MNRFIFWFAMILVCFIPSLFAWCVGFNFERGVDLGILLAVELIWSFIVICSGVEADGSFDKTIDQAVVEVIESGIIR